VATEHEFARKRRRRDRRVDVDLDGKNISWRHQRCLKHNHLLHPMALTRHLLDDEVPIPL